MTNDQMEMVIKKIFIDGMDEMKWNEVK